MAKLNPCFKRTFVFFNVLFAIAGILILILAVVSHVVLSHQQVEGKELGLFVLYFSGILTFIVSVLGAYGAHKENKCALITFFVIMCVGTIVLFRITFPLAFYQNGVLQAVRGNLNGITPLNTASKDTQSFVENLQEKMKCCGVFKGYEDWGEDVPASCNCVTDRNEPDQCQRVTVRKLWTYSEAKTMMVYSKPCGTLLMYYVEKFISIFLGVFFALAVLALLASVMSLGMIIRISSSPQRSAPVLSFNYQPPKYSELYNVSSKFSV